MSGQLSATAIPAPGDPRLGPSSAPPDGSKEGASSSAGGGRGRGGGRPPSRDGAGRRRVTLRQVLFAILLVPCIAPLLISSSILINSNKETLKDQEKVLLTNSAQEFVGRLSENLALRRVQIQQLARAVVTVTNMASLEDRLREPWVVDLFQRFLEEQPDLLVLNAFGQNRRGLSAGRQVSEQAQDALVEAFDTALRLGEVAYKFAVLSTRQEPAVAIAVPVPVADGSDILVMQALLPLDLAGSANTSREAFDRDDFFLVEATGELLWTASSQELLQQELLRTPLVEDFPRNPTFSVTGEYELSVAGKPYPVLARVVQVRETGWGLVAHKARDVAFQQVSEMVFNTVLVSVLAVMLALLFVIGATRWFAKPIQGLAETSHEIAAGKFGRRVEVEGLVTAEIADLATDFNRMGDYVESYIEQLRKAAEANRALFISSIRAFAAAIDAKDPYTRGHSERVAAYSRSIARYLGVPKDQQEKVWISGVLHDVGKIGVQDRVLLKQGVLTPAEFEQMKQHPSIGADIIEPISALRDMIPGIRWHHEAWNGTGYPDRLKGEQIPLMARVIGVADTFDAITTNRPYQTASSAEYAIETIKRLTGTKFDAKVVTAFLLAWEAGHIKLDRERANLTAQQLAKPETPAAGAVRAPAAT
ncbi:MAG: HD domain-containing protein [Holophagales bacterium]|nr:HD domain-containing protein [Holophagales bacterium]